MKHVKLICCERRTKKREELNNDLWITVGCSTTEVQRTHGEVWKTCKVMEFYLFLAWKGMEFQSGSWKVMEND